MLEWKWNFIPTQRQLKAGCLPGPSDRLWKCANTEDPAVPLDYMLIFNYSAFLSFKNRLEKKVILVLSWRDSHEQFR